MEKLGIKSRFYLLLSQTNMAIFAKITVIVLASVSVFFQDLILVFNDALKSEITSYTLVIPFIFVYLIYRKRKMLRAVIPLKRQTLTNETKHLSTIAGILLFSASILLYWYGSYTFTPLEFHISVLPIFAAGLILILFNPQTLRQLIFPIAFLILLIPPPIEIIYGLGSTLSIISSETSYAIVNALGIPATISIGYGSPMVIITRLNGAKIPFAVDIACSGIYSLLGFLVFTIFFTYLIRDKPWKKLLLVVIGFPLIYLLNIIRLTLIFLLGYHFGEEIALQIFHLLGGWMMIFLGTLLLLIVSEKLLHAQLFTTRANNYINHNPTTDATQEFCIKCGKILRPKSLSLSKYDLTRILAITLVVLLIMSIQAPVFALTKGPAIVEINTPSGQKIPTKILPELSGYKLDFIYRDTQFEEYAKQDMAVSYKYTPINQAINPIWVAIEIASAKSNLHRWETCLIDWPITNPGYQPRATQIQLKDIPLTENPPIIARYFVFNLKATNRTQTVLYWYETATFSINSTSQQKHVKISLIAYPDNQIDFTQLENQLLTEAKRISDYWQPIKSWSQVALLLSLSGDKLVMIVIALLLVVSGFYLLKKREERQRNLQAYQKLSKFNRQIFDAALKAEKTTGSTLENISIIHHEIAKKSINKLKLKHYLAIIEKIGLLKKVIAAKNDEPIIFWKTQI